MAAALRWLADATSVTAELLRLMDATRVPCGQSAVIVKRPDLFGYAGCGHCASHFRWYWGCKLMLTCTYDGTVTGSSLANPKPARKDEKQPRPFPNWLRQRVELSSDARRGYSAVHGGEETPIPPFMFSFSIRYKVRVSRYRIYPDPDQEQALPGHCAHARYVWNLAVEQHAWWRPGRTSAPGYLEQSRQLTAARAGHPWLAAGSQTVQQQALRDFAQAMSGFFAGTHGRPSWCKAGRDVGFRITGQRGRQWDVRRLNRHWGQVRIPKAGWVKFRWSRPVPEDVKSFRITRDRAGRWHVSFAHIPGPVPAPGNGQIIGVDRGVAVSAALSTGEMLTIPGLSKGEQRRLARLQRKLAKARKGSNRGGTVKAAIARLKAREAGRRKDWCEKLSTHLARRFDIIRIENLNIMGMTRSAKGTLEKPGRNVAAKTGLNRGIVRSGWGPLARRLEDKAPARVEKVDPAFTSQRCSACGQVDRKSRESQALFRPTACGHALNADVNAAKNIAAGGDCAGRTPDCRPCEPRTPTAAPNGVAEGISRLQTGEDVN